MNKYHIDEERILKYVNGAINYCGIIEAHQLMDRKRCWALMIIILA